MKKLSSTQRTVLQWLSEEKNVALYMPYAGRFNPRDYWFDSHGMRNIRCSTMDKLVALGLVGVTAPSTRHAKACITDAGRVWIASYIQEVPDALPPSDSRVPGNDRLPVVPVRGGGTE